MRDPHRRDCGAHGRSGGCRLVAVREATSSSARLCHVVTSARPYAVVHMLGRRRAVSGVSGALACLQPSADSGLLV